jgi:hypothetical protein
VSTYAGQLESASTLPAERILERRLTRYLIAIGRLLTGVGAFVLVATSDHLVDPVAYGLLLADVVIGTTAGCSKRVVVSPLRWAGRDLDASPSDDRARALRARCGSLLENVLSQVQASPSAATVSATIVALTPAG